MALTAVLPTRSTNDLITAVEKKIQVLEVTGSNVTSVAEHVVMSILLLVRNFVPAHEMIERGDWKVSDVARNAFDLEGKVVGTLGAGRIGYRVLQRVKPFGCKELLYYDYTPLPQGTLQSEMTYTSTADTVENYRCR